MKDLFHGTTFDFTEIDLKEGKGYNIMMTWQKLQMALKLSQREYNRIMESLQD